MIIMSAIFRKKKKKEEEYFKNAEDTEGLTNILLKTDYYDIS